MTETKPGEPDPVVEYFGEERVAELTAKMDALIARQAERAGPAAPVAPPTISDALAQLEQVKKTLTAIRDAHRKVFG